MGHGPPGHMTTPPPCCEFPSSRRFARTFLFRSTIQPVQIPVHSPPLPLRSAVAHGRALETPGLMACRNGTFTPSQAESAPPYIDGSDFFLIEADARLQQHRAEHPQRVLRKFLFQPAPIAWATLSLVFSTTFPTKRRKPPRPPCPRTGRGLPHALEVQPRLLEQLERFLWVSLPFESSVPTLSRPTSGFFVPTISCAYTDPITANWPGSPPCNPSWRRRPAAGRQGLRSGEIVA